VVTAVPESFDSMLAELADAAASSVPTPDLADVRRRARQRTVRRRATASALAFALVCVSGVAAAAIGGHARPAERVTPLSAPSAAALATSGASGSATPAPTPTGPGGGTDYAAYAGVWSTGSLLASYAIVFPDGVVGVAQKTAFPLCYGQVATEASASPATGVTLSRATPMSEVPFTQGDCDGSIGAGTLVLGDAGGSPSLTVTDSAKPTVGSPLVFQRVASIEAAATAAADSAAVVKQLAGDWMELDDKSQMLSVDADGAVAYYTVGAGDSGSGFSGKGELDGYYGLSARALTECSSTEQSQAAKDGVGLAGKFCGVLLLHVGPAATEMSVYTGVGLQLFVRVE
jgi:hypothetical protein